MLANRYRLSTLLTLTTALALGGGGCSDDDGGSGICGDGDPTGLEGCDDGNTTDGDGCNNNCEVEHGYVCFETPSICLPSCGDGVVANIEGCDDGNLHQMDGCNNNCEVEFGYQCSGDPSTCDPVCGDGQVVGDEPCDDGNNLDDDGCSADCEVESGYECEGAPSACHGVCGNSGMTPDEGCDDGNTAAGDGCSADCQVETGYDCTGQPSACVTICGDGLVAGDEPCDDAGESASCDDDCTPAICGDALLNVTAGEACDTGGESATCDVDCTIPECGDGDVNGPSGEGCDDGDTVTGDGCDDQCAPEAGYYCSGEPSVCNTNCGDSTVAGNEDCDDGGESATCDVNCTFASCGDSTVNTTAGETCDDGDLVTGDGCDDQCLVEYGYACTGEPSSCQVDCGDGIIFGAEQCDDSGETMTCDANCTFVSCGDGDLNTTSGETCDDGNNTSGDGCDATCHIEFVCGDLVCDVLNGETCQACPGDCCPNCGNGQLEAHHGEDCDLAAFGGLTCADFCYTGGSLTCTAYCAIDTSSCTGALPPCGDNVIGCGEQCDSANLNSQTCTSLGYDGGTLGCSTTCQFDYSQCGNPFQSCQQILTNSPTAPSGVYTIDADGPGGALAYDVYCDMDTDSGGWTYIAALSNGDGVQHWVQPNPWWYATTPAGDWTNPTTAMDAISPAYYTVGAQEFMIRDSDSGVAYRRSTGGCLLGATFGAMIAGLSFTPGTLGLNQCAKQCDMTGSGSLSTTYYSMQSVDRARFGCNDSTDTAGMITLYTDTSYYYDSMSQCNEADYGLGSMESPPWGLSFNADVGTGGSSTTTVVYLYVR